METCKNRLNNMESGINYDSIYHCALLTTIKHNETNNLDNSKPITKVLHYQRVERQTNKAPKSLIQINQSEAKSFHNISKEARYAYINCFGRFCKSY